METTDYTTEGVLIPHAAEVAHYHGDGLRILFITIAALMLVLQFTGNDLPMTNVSLIGFVAVLAIAAGITNPVQRSIHWFNMVLSLIGLAIFGSVAIERLHSLSSFFTRDGLLGLIAFLFLIGLYLATRTLRGVVTGSNRVAGVQ
jgi:hypothetical protein